MTLQKGHTHLESVLATVLFVSFIGLFVYKMLAVVQFSERFTLEGRITQLQAALDLQFAELMMIGKQATAVNFEKTNPMRLFQKLFPHQVIEGYLGEQSNLQFDQLPAGSWVFDQNDGVLLYKLKHKGALTNFDPKPSRIQWRIKATLIEENNPFGEGVRQRVESLKLEPLYEFKWND